MALSPDVKDLVARALAEDVGSGDVTTDALVGPDRSRARIVQKQPGVVFGLDLAEAVFRARPGGRLAASGEVRRGSASRRPRRSRRARALLTGERTALNFLGHLSGIATLTALRRAGGRGTGVTILDTRKTTPGLRELEKAAVAAGGGRNHRIGLYDAIIIKENHIAAAGGIAGGGAGARAAAARPPARGRGPRPARGRPGAGGRRAAPAAGQLRPPGCAPRWSRSAAGPSSRRAAGSRCRRSEPYAVPGLDFISMGALTHSAPPSTSPSLDAEVSPMLQMNFAAAPDRSTPSPSSRTRCGRLRASATP